MFGRVLEKALLNVIGPYVEGIDRKNLEVGLWKGNVSISNISLKQNVVEMLDFPLLMKCSSIGRLSVSVPWKHLGSKPVEIVLEDVVLLVEPKSRETWQEIDFRTVDKKLKMMDAFVKSYMAKLAEKRKETKGLDQLIEKDEGLVAKLSIKAIDNVQISVRNIHARLEDPYCKRPYALGLTLDEVLINTTNALWETQFIDRTIAENKMQPMRKKLLLKNLGVYWDSNASDLLGALSPQDIHQKLQAKVLRDADSKEAVNYIINLSAECRLTQRNKRDFASANDPEFDVALELAPIDVLLQKTQVEDMVHLIELFNDYQRFQNRMLNKIKKEETEFSRSEEQIAAYREEFKMLFTKIQLNDEEEGLQNMDKVREALDGPEQAHFFEELLIKLPDADIALAVKESLKLIEKDKILALMEEKEKQLRKSQGKRAALLGWFKKKTHKLEAKKEELSKSLEKSMDKSMDKSMESSTTSTSSFWDNEEMERVEKFIEESFPTEEEMETTELKNIIRFNFVLQRGTLYLCNVIGSGHEEGLMLDLNQLTVNAHITSQTKKVNIALQDFGFSLRTKYASSYSYLDAHIIRRVNHWLPPEKSGSLASISFEENPDGQKGGTYIDVKLQQIEIVYRKALIDRLKDYFSAAIENSAVKNQYEKTQANDNSELQPKNPPPEKKEPTKRTYISVDIDAPVLVVPLLQNGDIKSECWVLNLGHLVVMSKDPMTDEGLLYELYEIGLADIKFEYYPSQALYMKVMRSMIDNGNLSLLNGDEEDEHKKTFNLIEKFNIDVKVNQMLQGLYETEEGKGQPKMDVNVSIPIIHLQLTADTYKGLLKLPPLFDFANEVEIEQTENEREKLQVKNDRIGSLYVQEKKLGKTVWTKCDCILKDNYLYLFKQADDQRPAFTYYIVNSTLSDYENTEKKFAFVLENKHNKGALAAETEQEKQDWLQAIVEKIDENSAPNMFKRSKTLKKMKTKKPEDFEEQLKNINYEDIETKVWFEIKEVKLTLYHTDDLKNKLIELDTKNFQMDLQQKPKMTVITTKLESLDVNDFLFEFTNPNLKKLITSVPPIETKLKNADLIEVHIINIEENHPKYNETLTKSQIKVNFGYLYVNFKPDVVGKVVKFLVPVTEELKDVQKPPERKKTQENVTKKEVTYTENVSNTVMNVEVNLQEVGLRLVHMKSHACMAELAVKEIKLNLKQKPYLMEFDGVLGNIQAFDTTNYPHTIDSNLEYTKIKKYELLGVGEKSENLLHINFKQYQPEHPDADNTTHKHSFADIKMSSIHVNLLQKPIFRLIDYIQAQVVPSITPPEGALPEQQGQGEDAQVVNQISQEEAEKRIHKPSFLELKVHIGTPIIHVKPLPDSPEYLDIKLGDLTVGTDIFPDYTRLKNPKSSMDFVYCQKYNITLQNLGIFRATGLNKAQMTQEVNFDVTVDMPTLLPEYGVLYQFETGHEEENVTRLDQRLGVTGKMSPLIVTLTHDDLMLVMRIVNKNLAHDDGMDAVYESAPAPQPQPKAQNKKPVEHKEKEGQEQLEAQANKKGEQEQGSGQIQPVTTPLRVDFTFENFTVLTLDKLGLPFAMINIHVLQIKVNQKNNSLRADVRAYELNGTYFEKSASTLTERRMLGMLDRVREHHISGKRNDVVIQDILTTLTQHVKEIATRSQPEDAQINVGVEMHPDGKKIMRLDLNGLNLYLVPDIFLNLVKFLELEPEEANKEKEKEKEKQKEKEKEKEEPPKPQTIAEGSLRVELAAKNILVTIPASNLSINSSPYVLALRTDILCGLDMYSAPSLEKSLKGIKDQECERATQQCTENNETMHVKATISRCEVFICEYDELISARDFAEVRKRHLILPFTLSFTRKAYLVPNKLKTDLIQVAKNDASMEIIVLRMSYQDALLLNNTVEHQLGIFAKIKEENKKPEEAEDKNKSLTNEEISDLDVESTRMGSQIQESFEESKEDQKEQVDQPVSIENQINEQDNWEPNIEEFDLESQGLQIVLINDAEENLVPVIELTVQDIAGSVFMANKKVRLDSLVHLSCSYFNPLPSKWEPIIEKFGLSIEVVAAENPKLSLAISSSGAYDTLNINISEEMLQTIYSTINTWRTDYQHKIVKQDKNNIPQLELTGYGNEEKTGVEVDDELIDYVSPYTIVNLTGYPIEIENDIATPKQGAPKKHPPFSRSRSTKLKDLAGKVYKIPNQEKSQYLVESNIEDLFKKSVHDTMVGINHIAVKIKHPDYDINYISGVDIDRARITGYNLEGKGKNDASAGPLNMKLFSDISLDKNTKTITLSSPYRITNKTQTAYTVILEGNQRSLELSLAPGKTVPVPIDLADATLSIKSGEEGSSMKRPLSDFAGKSVEEAELQAGSTFLLAESVKKDAEADVYEISLQPTFQVKNCCPLEVYYKVIADEGKDEQVRRLKPQEAIQESKMSQRQQVFIQVRVQGFLWSDKFQVYSGKAHGKKEHDIVLKDAAGESVTMTLYYPEDELGTRKFMLYTKECIINETPYDLKFFVPGDKQKASLPGQLPVDEGEVFNSKVLLVNETKRLAISRKGTNEHSGLINVGSVGSSYVELNEEHHNTMLELGLDMKVIQCDKEYRLLTKIISISPRYILVNKTPHKVEIRRDGGTKNPIVLDKNAREAFQWSDWASNVQEKSIAVRLQDANELDLWGWSKGFDITSVGEYNFLARSRDKSQTKFLKATVTMEDCIVFVIIEEDKEGNAFKIRNDCPGLEIRVCQEGASLADGTTIKSGETIPWSWEFPNRKQQVLAAFGDGHPEHFGISEQHFKFETLNKVKKVELPESFKAIAKRIFALVVMEGNSRVLVFFTPEKGKTGAKNKAMKLIEESQKVGRSGDKPVYNMNLDVRLGGLGLSVISKLTNRETKRKERREVLYLWLGGIEVKLLDSEDTMTAQARLKFLNLDNNAVYDTSFPVLLTPERPEELAVGTKNYLLDVLVSQKKNSDILHFETIQFLLAELSIRADGLFLDAVLETVNNFSEIFKNADTAAPAPLECPNITEGLFNNSEEAKKLEDPEYFNSKFSWISRPTPQLNSNLFIESLAVYPIFVNLSFQLKKLEMREHIHFVGNLLASTLGSTIVNLDNAPIKLKGFRLENLFDSQEVIAKKILDKIQDDAIKSVLKLIGSLDIIGNPVGLFSSLSTGVVDLFEKPIDGFLQGPLEGGRGILVGAGSLVKNTVSGTFNTLGKVTGSIASGVSNLAMDDEYLSAREKARMKRPEHLGEGLYQGLAAFLRGLGYGVKGVVTQPVEGAEREGVPGLLKGTAKGVTGLVVKPVVGVLDAAAKTAEGVKNTATLFDQRPNSLRLRHPRAFYGAEKFYRTYMDTDAEILSILHNHKQHTYRDMSLINTFEVYPEETSNENLFILALSYEHILCWNVKAAKLEWSVNPRDVKKITLYQNGIQLDLPKQPDATEESYVAVQNGDAIQNEYIAQRIAQLKKHTE